MFINKIGILITIRLSLEMRAEITSLTFSEPKNNKIDVVKLQANYVTLEIVLL